MFDLLLINVLAQTHDVGGADVELGLLRDSSASTFQGEDSYENTPQVATSVIAEPRSNSHQIIGEALELFSKHLRTGS